MEWPVVFSITMWPVFTTKEGEELLDTFFCDIKFKSADGLKKKGWVSIINYFLCVKLIVVSLTQPKKTLLSEDFKSRC